MTKKKAPKHTVELFEDKKACSSCKTALLKTEFRKDSSKKDGLTNVCKACKSRQDKARYKANPEYFSKRSKAYYQENRDNILARASEYYKENREAKLTYNKQYREDNREELNAWKSEYLTEKYKTDEQYREKHKIKQRFYQNQLKYEAGREVSDRYRQTFELLGEKPSPKHQVDHIIPFCVLDLTDPLQRQIATHPANHRWLTAEENNERNHSDDYGAFIPYLESDPQHVLDTLDMFYMLRDLERRGICTLA